MAAAVLVLGACGAPDTGGDRAEISTDAPASIEVTSSAFQPDGTIPARFTCDGEDTSPPLAWSEVPDEAEELVLVVRDPDAPGHTFIHWLVAGVDATTARLEEGELPDGAVEGTNDFGEAGYRGPCPPPDDEAHRYEFVVHATAAPTGLGEQATVDEVREALAEHTVATGTLAARYGRAG